MEPVVAIQRNLEEVLERTIRAAQRAGRDPGQVRLVVVTKTQPVEVIAAAISAGARYLGENYADEALPKILALNQGSGVEWHMIGHVQSRKAQIVSENFAYLHSLDSVKLAHRLDRFAAEQGHTLPVLLECNVSGEESKFGWSAWDEPAWPGLFAEFAEILSLPNLSVRGLMTMAPYADDPAAARPHFQRLRRLRDRLAQQFPGAGWDELSMGMSADFETAVEEGATWIRVGQAILAREV